uniref:KIAA2026 n=1 Tax=Nothobranchius pienaari TaxID=704102 RepID=A0A1A8N7I2_9TELE
MTPNEATSKNTPSSPNSFSSSKVMLISQPSVTSTATFMGNLPKQVVATESGQSMISSVSSQTLTTKSSTNASSSSEASPKANNMTMPSSIAFSLGKTTSIGQTIGALSHCSSTTTPVSELGTSFSTAAITTGLVSFTTSATRCSSQLGTCSSLSTSSPLQGVAAISGISHVSCTSSTGPGLLKGNLNQNDPSILTSISPKSSPVQVTNSAGGSPAQTWTSVLHPKPHFFKSTLHEEHIALPPSSQLAHNKTQTTLSFASSTCTSFPTLTTGTVQQKIIINTSTHLTAGTQIFLNNARFVVPPQGLGPGSHVLIISSPEPQVPTATHTITGPSVALKGQSPTNFTPLAPVLPQTSAKLPLVPAEMAGLMSLGPTIQPEQTGVRFAAPSTVHPQSLVRTGLGNSLIKNHLPVLQPVLSGTKTQILPPMSVPTIVNAVTRMKQLPVATVPPVGSTVSTYEMAPANMAAPASTAVIVSPVQPITSMASRNAIQRPVILANKALRKDSVPISALGTHTSVPSKLLVSPDGAVLSTVQCRVSPANLNAFPKPLDALVVSSDSSIGALQTHDSSLHPLRADTSEPTEQH